MKLIKKTSSAVQHKLDMLAFKSSENYWIKRYKRGGDSGGGSYGELAQFKAGVINNFVETEGVDTLIEFGCGDGNQLALARYPHYIGFDVSPDAIAQCKKLFNNDPSKAFYLINEYREQKADLALSLDVIYHLVEDNVFEKYMQQLFCSSKRYVVVYSSNIDARLFSSPHVKHRQFTNWVESNLPDWDLVDHILNAFTDNLKSRAAIKADFFIYQKKIHRLD